MKTKYGILSFPVRSYWSILSEINMANWVVWSLLSWLYCMYVLDMFAAFDMVGHDILIHPISMAFGLRWTVLSWIEPVIHYQSRMVSFDGQLSAEYKVICNVPQGSVWGPILFVLYTADDINRSSTWHQCQYAHMPMTHNCTVTRHNHITHYISMLLHAYRQSSGGWHRTHLNWTLTKLSLCGLEQVNGICKSVKIGDTDITFFTEVTNLGVIFDRWNVTCVFI